MRNDVVLCWLDDGLLRPSHFKLSEFESENGLVVVDPSLVQSLELTRIELERTLDKDIKVDVTSGTRTEEDNKRMAERLGWAENGGLVARNSRHLPKFGGIAADIYARYWHDGAWLAVPQAVLAKACRNHFAYVKADYVDGHVHADNRAA